MGGPLKMLYANLALDEPDLNPFYDVIFAHPGINFDAPITKKGAPVRRTLRDMAAANTWKKPEFTRRMLAYEAKRALGGQP